MQEATPTSSEIVDLLRGALDQGHSITIALARPNTALETPLTMLLGMRLGLSPTQSRIVALLLEHGGATREDLSVTMSPSSLGVTVSNLRRRLAQFDIEIGTVWGHGYQLAAAEAAKIRKLLTEAAATPSP
jgi:hypothetical protein